MDISYHSPKQLYLKLITNLPSYMDVITMPEKYKIIAPEKWTESFDDERLKSLIKETAFSKKQEADGKDFCYFLYKKHRTANDGDVDYTFMAYTLNESSNLEHASVSDIVLEDNATYFIHRISVYRDGQLIDKIPDTKIKILDNENESGGGMLNNTQKVNLTIKDLRLYDVLILEDSKSRNYSDRDLLLKDFMRYLWVSPDNYWAYGIYDFKVINDRKDTIVYRNNFFRDANGALLPAETKLLPSGESYLLHYDNYIVTTDANREIFPFIDFATEKSWTALSSHIYSLYEEAFTKQKLSDFAPELVTEIDAISDKDEQLRFAIEFVQNHVQYLFNAYEMNGHKPQDPAITYETKQGDCKAKTTLLKLLLDHIGVESSIILVNFRSDFYFKYYLPSLLAFNHVIVKINYKGATYFVDATSKDGFGLIENRDVISFCHYLEILPNKELQKCEPYKYQKFAIDEIVEMSVNGNSGLLKVTSTYRYNRANNMRRHMKRTSKKETIDSWNKSFFNSLNYCNDRDENDLRKIFKDADIRIVLDEKDQNEFVVEYTANIENPYYSSKQGSQFLMYFDTNLIKYSILDFISEDATFWFSLDSERYVVNLSTDQRIDTTEKYTIQECTIRDKYFDYSIRKNINKNKGTATIEFQPVSNQEIKSADYETFRKDYQKITNSNYGLGLDIIPSGFSDRLKFNFKKMFGK